MVSTGLLTPPQILPRIFTHNLAPTKLPPQARIPTDIHRRSGHRCYVHVLNIIIIVERLGAASRIAVVAWLLGVARQPVAGCHQVLLMAEQIRRHFAFIWDLLRRISGDEVV